MAIEVASREIYSYKRNPTYQTDALTKSRAGGNSMQNIDYTLEQFHHFAVVSSKFSKGLCLLLKDCGDGLDRIAIFELPSERMVDQFHSCLLFVVMQGSLEEQLKHRFAHITGEGICEELRDRGTSGKNVGVGTE
jgi:hypothetical protein